MGKQHRLPSLVISRGGLASEDLWGPFPLIPSEPDPDCQDPGEKRE